MDTRDRDERESTRPRELGNAETRESWGRPSASPCDWDPTAGGRDGIVHPEEPGASHAHIATQDGMAIWEAEHPSAADVAEHRGRTLGLAGV